MEDELRQAVAEVLIELRNEKGVSQEELAYRTNIDRSYISQIERQKKNPTLLKVFGLALGLDMTPDDMITRIQNKCPNIDKWLMAEAN